MKNEQILTYPEAAKMFFMSYSTFVTKTARSEFAKFRTQTKRMHKRKKYNTPVYRIFDGVIVNDEFKKLIKLA